MSDASAVVKAEGARAVSASGASTTRGQDLGRRRTAAPRAPDRPNSTAAANAGGSTATMLKLYTNDDTPGLRVDPLVVLVLAVVFIFSVVALHLLHKVIRYFA